MGFTIEDMRIVASSKYKMELVAGKNGWANSISWLLMVEDTTITDNFVGKELVVTTGLGFGTEEKLRELVKILDEHHCSGLIVNTGYYIKEIPESVLKAADECDLPLLTVPWEMSMADMIKDLTVRIFLQSQTDEQISSAFIKAIEHPQAQEEYRDDLSAAFDVDGKFQVAIFTTESLDTMDSMDRKRIGYRLQIYLENISHNAHFLYYNGYFLLIFNAVEESDRDWIIDGFLKRVRNRMPDREVYVGIGSPVYDAGNISISYRRAEYAARKAFDTGKPLVMFDELGLERLVYSLPDELLIKEMGENLLKPVIEYDKKHDSGLVETLKLYLEYNGSVNKMSAEMFIHKNTILYRMKKIKELTDFDPEDGKQRLEYYLATLLYERERIKNGAGES
ncbi:MAG: PucR family transcriptional regulator ligand-binding domain-containing protein [Lachnospiraceae bacterium]|nr:PucR family transcriptional regulator ligand-binding domain-containing protein [Lachnospiraceae bacterium]